MKKIRITVQGRVQGVGFRYTTKMLADRLGVTGAVWNEADGSVGIEAIAQEAVMAVFLKELKASPTPAGKVNQLIVKEDPTIKSSEKFAVTYSPH